MKFLFNTILFILIFLKGFREMQENKQQIIGSSTACLMMLSHTDLKLYTANIGDSGFLVVRQVVNTSYYTRTTNSYMRTHMRIKPHQNLKKNTLDYHPLTFETSILPP